MALPFELQIGRISRFLSKWGGTKGSSPRLTLGSELTPTLAMWQGSENRFLDSWNRYGSFLTQVAGAAGTFSQLQLRNPTGSKIIAIIEKIALFDNTATDSLTLRNGVTVDLATVLASGVRLDSRGSPASVCIPSTQAVNSAPGNIFGGVQALLNTNVDFILTENMEIPVLPGDGVLIRSNTAVHQIGATIVWRERSLEDSEAT